MEAMKAPPHSTKDSLTARLNDHARTRWPELAGVDLRFRANFAYVDGRYRGRIRDQTLPAALRRLRPPLGLRHLPSQPRRLRKTRSSNRDTHRHRRGSPRLRLRALPQRPDRMAVRYTDELTGLAPSGPRATASSRPSPTAQKKTAEESGPHSRANPLRPRLRRSADSRPVGRDGVGRFFGSRGRHAIVCLSFSSSRQSRATHGAWVSSARVDQLLLTGWE